MDVDDDVVPVINALDSALVELQESMNGLFDSSVLNEETIPEKLSIEEQANFANVSAFALATCFYAFKRVNGLPIDPQLLEKISRVKEYAAKVKEAHVTETLKSTQAAKGKRQKTTRPSESSIPAPSTGAKIDDVDDAAEKPAKAHRPQVNKEAYRRLTQL